MNNRVEIFSDKFKSIKLSLMGIFMTVLSMFILLFGFSIGNIYLLCLQQLLLYLELYFLLWQHSFTLKIF